MAEKTPRQPREARLLAEWLPQRFPRAERLILNQRLGSLPRESDGTALTWEKRAMLGVFNRYADALVVDAGALYLIEAGIRAAVEKVAQLEIYERLIPQTEELAEIHALPRRLILLTATEDSLIRAYCADKGIEMAVFRPPWVVEYMSFRPARKRESVSLGGRA